MMYAIHDRHQPLPDPAASLQGPDNDEKRGYPGMIDPGTRSRAARGYACRIEDGREVFQQAHEEAGRQSAAAWCRAIGRTGMTAAMAICVGRSRILGPASAAAM